MFDFHRNILCRVFLSYWLESALNTLVARFLFLYDFVIDDIIPLHRRNCKKCRFITPIKCNNKCNIENIDANMTFYCFGYDAFHKS